MQNGYLSSRRNNCLSSATNSCLPSKCDPLKSPETYDLEYQPNQSMVLNKLSGWRYPKTRCTRVFFLRGMDAVFASKPRPILGR